MQPTEIPTPIETRGILSRSMVSPTAPIPTTLRSKMDKMPKLSPEEYTKHISMAKDAIFRGDAPPGHLDCKYIADEPSSLCVQN